MLESQVAFSLASKDGGAPAPVLVGVQAQGRLDAVLFELTLRQTYRNTSHQVLEVVYTFPLPPMAVLLGFASELNGERQDGVVVARREAERQYEDALAEGDAPVMLEAHRDGLHTANIGNLKPGDELVLECRLAQLLQFEQGRLRVSIPTTIAPRYGQAGQAGLQPQQVPTASLAADYPLGLSLVLGAGLAGATAECPTHRLATRLGANGELQMDLAAGARLDRDVVVIVTPRETTGSLRVQAHDPTNAEAPVVVLAALQPLAAPPREAIAVKLLVDCSGSMSGDSIASARAALRGVVSGLSERDYLSLSRFGSRVEHLFAPSRASPQALRHLRPVLDGIQADLGGTEMEHALKSVFDLPGGSPMGGADVLLITDGEIWQADETMAAARRSGHRVFAIGVGSAPAEGVLRALAEATGGACEFATPGEGLEAAARRMLHRMHQPIFSKVRIDWGREPVWSCAPQASVFAGDTVTAFAAFSRATSPRTVRLLADDAQGQTLELARSEAEAPACGDALPRIAAARRIAQGPETMALELALQYQLITSKTHCILVHRRAKENQASEPSRLQRVDSMLAAGWGGLGVMQEAAPAYSTVVDLSCGSHSDLSVSVSVSVEAFELPIHRSASLSAPALMSPADAPADPASWVEIGQWVADHLGSGQALNTLALRFAGLSLPAEVQQALEELQRLGLSEDQAWLLLGHWLNTRAGGLADADRAAQVAAFAQTIDSALARTATRSLEQRLAHLLVDA